MLTIQTVMSESYTVLLLSAKTRQENQRNRLWKCIKKSSALSHKRGMKRELEKQGKCSHRLIVHSITRRDEIWGGGSEVRRQWEGRGWPAPLYQLIYEPGEMVWQYIYFSTLIKKGLLLTVIRIRGTAETRRCDCRGWALSTLISPLRYLDLHFSQSNHWT